MEANLEKVSIGMTQSELAKFAELLNEAAKASGEFTSVVQGAVQSLHSIASESLGGTQNIAMLNAKMDKLSEDLTGLDAALGDIGLGIASDIIAGGISDVFKEGVKKYKSTLLAAATELAPVATGAAGELGKVGTALGALSGTAVLSAGAVAGAIGAVGVALHSFYNDPNRIMENRTAFVTGADKNYEPYENDFTGDAGREHADYIIEGVSDFFSSISKGFQEAVNGMGSEFRDGLGGADYDDDGSLSPNEDEGYFLRPAPSAKPAPPPASSSPPASSPAAPIYPPLSFNPAYTPLQGPAEWREALESVRDLLVFARESAESGLPGLADSSALLPGGPLGHSAVAGVNPGLLSSYVDNSTTSTINGDINIHAPTREAEAIADKLSSAFDTRLMARAWNKGVRA